MSVLGLFKSKKVLAGLALVLVLAGVLWIQRKPLLAWYYLRGLASASDQDLAGWAKRVAALDDAALPGLLDLLRRDDPHVCANAGVALASLAERWRDRGPALIDRFTEVFLSRSLTGRTQLLSLAAALVSGCEKLGTGTGQRVSADLVLAGGRLLRLALQQPDRDVQTGAIMLAEALSAGNMPAEVLAATHDQARLGLASPNSRCRALALHLARSPFLNDQTDLLELVAPLLRDPSPEVRREALQAIGRKKEVVGSEDLLHWLHDPDREVRHWCETALLARGLTRMEIKLGRLITDPNPQERLKVFAFFSKGVVKAPSEWLARLLDDPERAIRIAAARMAVELRVTSLSDRLQDLAQNDRDQTVREVADFWFRKQSSIH